MRNKDYEPPDVCRTCKEPYTKKPSPLAMCCSNFFHCCRDCTWYLGQVTSACGECDNVDAD